MDAVREYNLQNYIVLLVWLVGVVVRRYIDYLILLIPTPLVSVLFYSSIPTFCLFFKMLLFLLFA